jgi:hypothetical protein
LLAIEADVLALVFTDRTGGGGGELGSAGHANG